MMVASSECQGKIEYQRVFKYLECYKEGESDYLSSHSGGGFKSEMVILLGRGCSSREEANAGYSSCCIKQSTESIESPPSLKYIIILCIRVLIVR